MAAYEDLSPYDYTGGQPAMLNVGWLGTELLFSTGHCEPEVREALVRLAMHPAHVMRGLHNCELCDEESPIVVECAEAPKGIVYVGTGEIRVADGEALYAAPTLIIHYIDSHLYLPPEVFRRAVLGGGTHGD